jgi:hypothetical protein
MADDAKTADGSDAETADQPDDATKSRPGGPTMLGHDPTGMRSQLSRPSDVAARPGFRAPTNARSKAQTKKRKAARKS